MVDSHVRAVLSRPVLATIAAALLFGASTPLAKALLSSLGPLTLAGLLYLGGAVYVFWPGRFSTNASSRRNWELRLALPPGST